ncbi:ferric reductase NAD binding domain-containing protein [Annulohypoxylon maeteangense]|uniref:ferric reductase NAD binding domain-containing protein n=1 Tax=Annulohypoxylon maeteangense TaxID=1927788 RepID=UPI002008A555|nr:ferric reductase NAD binding domain-containing protein [Annulohypoxylon maeteangense]KAI0881833.1 ferric reductase NAD binding domain-containing protein [Annulohypoxylon maeteangense]
MSSVSSIHQATATASASSGGSSRAAWLLARQKVNTRSVTYYAASLSALIGIFIIAHWLRFTFVKLGWSRSRNPILLPFFALSRVTRRIFVRSLPGFTSVGHAVLVTVYVALNATFGFYNVDYSVSANVASRLGWIATGNMVFVVFLSLKNTPLAFLTAYSYERLNVLHRIAGYTTMLCVILHGGLYTSYFIGAGRISTLREEVVTAGIISGFTMFGSVMAGMILRRFNYELFYIVHVILFFAIVVSLGLHRPELDSERTLYATIILAALWFADRLIRFCRLVYNSVNNEANIYALPDGGTRIVLKKPISRARPGKHCYVWLPKIRTFETHPFTIVASEPFELVINSYSGFTRDLHNHALKNPGASLKVSVEGPYGTVPDPLDFDKVVLVAGGSGATFTFGIAADMLSRMSESSKQQIDFIWAVKGHDNLTWFTQHLNNLRNHVHAPKIALKVHVTRLGPESLRNSSLEQPASDSSTTDLGPSALEKGNVDYISSSGPASSAATRYESDREEKDTTRPTDFPSAATSTTNLNLPIRPGRPNAEAEIREAVSSMTKNQRVLIASCGPDSLTNIVRNVAASCISVDGPAVEVHCEQFGW